MAKRMLDATLWALTVLFLAFVVLGNDDPFARTGLFHGALPEESWHAKTVYKGLYDFGMGGLVSLFFYLLLVRFPDNAKRRRIRRGLAREYKRFKEDCLFTILGVVDTIFDLDTVDQLLSQEAFKAYFEKNAKPTQDRWDVFLNEIDETSLQRILRAIDRLHDEIAFTLSVIDVPEDGAFEFFKRFSGIAHDLKGTQLGYDTIKPLSNFLWSLLSGFDVITGYQKEDLVAKMIRSI